MMETICLVLSLAFLCVIVSCILVNQLIKNSNPMNYYFLEELQDPTPETCSHDESKDLFHVCLLLIWWKILSIIKFKKK